MRPQLISVQVGWIALGLGMLGPGAAWGEGTAAGTTDAGRSVASEPSRGMPLSASLELLMAQLPRPRVGEAMSLDDQMRAVRLVSEAGALIARAQDGGDPSSELSASELRLRALHMLAAEAAQAGGGFEAMIRLRRLRQAAEAVASIDDARGAVVSAYWLTVHDLLRGDSDDAAIQRRLEEALLPGLGFHSPSEGWAGPVALPGRADLADALLTVYLRRGLLDRADRLLDELEATEGGLARAAAGRAALALRRARARLGEAVVGSLMDAARAASGGETSSDRRWLFHYHAGPRRLAGGSALWRAEDGSGAVAELSSLAEAWRADSNPIAGPVGLISISIDGSALPGAGWPVLGVGDGLSDRDRAMWLASAGASSLPWYAVVDGVGRLLACGPTVSSVRSAFGAEGGE